MLDNLNGKIITEAITFDDVLLVPAYSEVLPHLVSLKTQLTQKITLNIPILSAAMDTVTEAPLAQEMARLGGLGFIHKNLSIEAQAAQVAQVKAHNPENAENACLDSHQRLRVGAAVGVGADTLERVRALVEAGADILTVDSAHGHSKGVIDTVRKIRENFADLQLVGGNIVTADAAHALVEAGANAVKVGVGPGSICTTRVIAGVGMPQLSAVNAVAQYCQQRQISVIADGGIKYSGDVVKAIAAGADCIMAGGLFAGTDASPGEIITEPATGQRFKTYVGMGSLAAMERGSKDRYFQQKASKLVPEGIEGRVPYKGLLADVVFQLCGGLRSGMGYCGTESIVKLKTDGRFVKITAAGLKESHPHDVKITQAAPNY